jgi:hypothetical protein
MYTCNARNWKFGYTIRRMQLCSMRKCITLNALYSNTGRNVHSRVSSLSRSFHLFYIRALPCHFLLYTFMLCSGKDAISHYRTKQYSKYMFTGYCYEW